MHAALDINIPNYANAVMTTEEIFAHSALADENSSPTSSETQKGFHQ
jgi:hypothetical protein